MASKLAHPSSSDDLRRFRDRIRKSPPAGTIDAKWLMDNLGITQRSNAGSFLSLLDASGFVQDGTLSERGRALLGSDDTDQYRVAMREAVDSLIGKDRADSLRAGSITKAQLPGYLQQQFNVGRGVVDKFFVGLRWLAAEGSDDSIVELCPPQRRSRGPVTPAPRPGGSQGQRHPATRNNSALQKPASKSAPVVEKAIPATSIAPLPQQGVSALLGGEVLQVRIDSNWAIEDVRSTLRMLQMIERGESIPSETSTATDGGEVHGDDNGV